MSKESFELLIEGGKAVANQALAQKLGPAGINISQVLNQVNTKTASFKGMKVPVKIIADLDDKTTEIQIGTPPVHELIKNEISLQKGSGTPDKLKVANLSVEQVIKIASMKRESMLVKTLKAAVKSVAGSCNSAGILIEGKQSHDFCQEVNKGIYDHEINKEIIDMPSEKKAILKEQLEAYNTAIKKELEKAQKEEASAGIKAPEKKEDKAAPGAKKDDKAAPTAKKDDKAAPAKKEDAKKPGKK